MLFFNKSLPSTLYAQTRLQQLSYINVEAQNYHILETPSHFHKRLLELIENAKHRILINALYIQDDSTGNEIIGALYKVLEKTPNIHIRVYVDFHRAQRGLIGKSAQSTNSQMYARWAENKIVKLPIYGVPVKTREIFGVLHLKGCVFDDTVLYSGASINDVYLGANGKYRLDRYHQIQSKDLANILCKYNTQAFHINMAVQDFSQNNIKSAKEIKDEIRALRRHLTQTQYQIKGQRIKDNHVGISAIAGLSKRKNKLNKVILWAICAAKKELFICTPYFNPPKIIYQAIEAALKKGVKINMVVGDKIANDFFIHEDEPFSTIGAIPYIYEQNLREFLYKQDSYIKNKQLNVYLWKDGQNTYHLKGLFIDRNFAIITGNNLNPRAWSLDLENALVVYDPKKLLQEKFMHEKQAILLHAKRLEDYSQIQAIDDYPQNVKKLLLKIKRFKASVFIKKLL